MHIGSLGSCFVNYVLVCDVHLKLSPYNAVSKCGHAALSTSMLKCLEVWFLKVRNILYTTSSFLNVGASAFLIFV